jgi:hypothetical protein
VGDSRVGPRQEFDYIGEPGMPIEVHEFGAAELGLGNGGMAACSRRFGSEKQKVGACNGHLPVMLPISGQVESTPAPSVWPL